LIAFDADTTIAIAAFADYFLSFADDDILIFMLPMMPLISSVFSLMPLPPFSSALLRFSFHAAMTLSLFIASPLPDYAAALFLRRFSF